MIEKQRVRVSTGSLPATKIATLAQCHPFSQQLDVVFPSNSALLESLEKLETSYAKGKAKLSDVVAKAGAFVNEVEGESNLLVVSHSTHEDDAWCIDPRGHLTLSLGKETYQRLGLVGQKLPFKTHSERHVFDIPLKKNALSATVRAKQKASLELWDKIRQDGARNTGNTGGAELWDTLYCSRDQATPPEGPFQGRQVHRALCQKKELLDVHIPALNLQSPPQPPSSKVESKQKLDHAEALEDWSRRVQNLFEWVGMAALGAQRLDANDRVDPYVALYEPPISSRVGNVTYLQWRGLLSPHFVQQILNAVISTLQTTSSPCPNFASITCHALTSSPVSYIPYTTAETGALKAPTHVPAKLPRAEGEDTWSLLFERPTDGSENVVRWCLAESLGQWDARWG
ncbi:hypothetical protein NLJ89_g10584 [Agrocybe chaxingu]|uniref:Uncharacterized protein n=1 Tax=Agrocybe chaxingu TaxID=84603 RepID=A0A9W8MSH1_9AGAR|nr:hypothetical protein NLJ89_g10584 [Agrocybe chaxingu]